MSWVVDVLLPLVGILLGGVLSLAVLTVVDLLARLVRLARHRRAFRSAVATPPAAPPRSWLPPPPSWSLTLLVDVDDEAGLFRPSVQLRGSSLPFAARLRLEVVDDHGSMRSSCERPLPPWAIGTEVALPAFAAPGGAALEDVLRWHWDVVLEDLGGERARWREHPAPAALNAEAELGLPGVAEI